MRQVEFFRWWVTVRGKRYLTSFPMDRETAEREYPGAEPDPGTRLQRLVPETEAERTEAMMRYQSAGHDSVKPPREK